MRPYAAFEVYYLESDGVKTPIPDAEVLIYQASDDTLLDTVNADSNGIVWPGEVDTPANEPIYYEYTESSVDYRGGQGVVTEFLYQDIVVADEPRQSFYPQGNVEPVAVEVWLKESADTNAAWRLQGTYAPTAEVRLPLSYAQDNSLDLRVVSIAPDGTRSVSEISHAPLTTIDFQLVNTECVLGQAGAATQTIVVIAVSNVAPAAVARRIRVYSDAACTTLLSTFYNQAPLPITEQIFGSASQTIYVKVAHSGTPGTAGPWGGESDPLMLTYESSGGGGGTSGDYDPYGRGYYEL